MNNDKKTLLKNIKNLKVNDSGVIVQKEKTRDHANKRKEDSSTVKLTVEKTPAVTGLTVYNLESQLEDFINRLQSLQNQYKTMDILKNMSDLLNKKIEKSKIAIKQAA